MKMPIESVIDFMTKADPDFGEKYSSYKRMRNEKINPKPEPSDKNYLFQIMYRHELLRNQIVNSKSFTASDEALKIMELCFNLDTLKDLEVVDSDGNVVHISTDEFYARSFDSNPESFWDTFFEIEAAGLLKRAGLDINPIDESQTTKSSADILFRENGKEYLIECKNKRRSTPYEWSLQLLGQSITRKLWSDYNLNEILGDDSFSVKVTSDVDFSNTYLEDQSFKDELVTNLSDQIFELVVEKGGENIITIRDVLVKVELTNYFDGVYEKELNSEELERFQMSRDITTVMNPFEHLNKSPNVMKENGHGNIQLKLEGNIVNIFQSYLFDFNIPWDIDYHNWITRTINSALEQHKGEDNLIVLIKVPTGIVYKMRRDKVVNHRGEEVTKWERLEEQIIGIFADENREDRLMVVVLITDLVRPYNGAQLVNCLKPIVNNNLKHLIPDSFNSFLDKHISIGEEFDTICYFNLG